MNKRANIFSTIIWWALGFIIFIFSAPIAYTIISQVVGGFGSATAFFVKLFLWIVLIMFLVLLIRIAGGGAE